MVGFLGIPAPFWGFLCLVVSILYGVFWPKKVVEAKPRTPEVRLYLRWGHSLVWILLSIAFFAWENGRIVMAGALAVAGGLAYLAFIILLIGQGKS